MLTTWTYITYTVPIGESFQYHKIVCSVTKLGDFWKFLVTNLLAKVAQIFGDLLCYFERHHLFSKNCRISFLGNYWKIWTTFYSNIFLSHWLCVRAHFISPYLSNRCDIEYAHELAHFYKQDITLPICLYVYQLQCDQIGRFFVVLCNKFAYNSIPKTLVTFWTILKSITFM